MLDEVFSLHFLAGVRTGCLPEPGVTLCYDAHVHLKGGQLL